MDAKVIADRYISRGGGKPRPAREDILSDILDLACFIGWHDDDHLMGGVKTCAAFEALCRVANIEAIELRRIVRGERG